MAANSIRKRRAELGGVPIAFETGVSYLPPVPGEIPDGEFAAAVAEAADCGVVLDLHNLLCNERNGRQSASDFCDSLPLERVWELHLAGGEDYCGFRLDAHSGLVEPALMDIVADLLPSLSCLHAIIFEIMPEYIPIVGLSEIGRQLERLNTLWTQKPKHVRMTQSVYCDRLNLLFGRDLEPRDWEMLLGEYVVGLPESQQPTILSSWWQAARPALDLYRQLGSEARASMLVATAPTTIRELLRQYGSTGTRQLLSMFWLKSRPAYTAIDEGRAFLRFISSTEMKVPCILTAVGSDQNQIMQLLEEVRRDTP